MILLSRPKRLPHGISRSHFYQLLGHAADSLPFPYDVMMAASAAMSDIAASVYEPYIEHRTSVCLFIVDPSGPTGGRLRAIEQKEDAPFWARENARRARVAERNRRRISP